jgi:hypothetical protein
MKYKLYELIVASANEGIHLQSSEGEMPKGHNGPWRDSDTFVRTTAHWALLFYKAYEITGLEKYNLAAQKACNYLLSKSCRPFDYTFYCRKNKTRCNGLIGQAWAIEPLIYIGKRMRKNDYLDLANMTLDLIDYDFQKHLWVTTEIDGRKLGYQNTLNQQIWLSAMAYLLGELPQYSHQEVKTKDFLLHISSYMQFISTKGLISHQITDVHPETMHLKDKLKRLFSHDREKTITKLSYGYLSFLFFGLALIYSGYGESESWDNSLTNIIKEGYCLMDARKPFGCCESESSYRWSYNPVGIEMAYFIQVFSGLLEIPEKMSSIEYWLNMQFQNYYDISKHMMKRNTVDPDILSSRLYEAVYLDNYSITLE